MPEEVLRNGAIPKETHYKLSLRKRIIIVGAIILFYPVCFLLQMISVIRVILPYEAEAIVFSNEFMQLYTLFAPALVLYLTRGGFLHLDFPNSKVARLPKTFAFLFGVTLLLTALCVGWMFRLTSFYMLNAFAVALSMAMVLSTLAFCILVFGNRCKANWQKSSCFLLCSIQVALNSYLQTLFNMNSDWLHSTEQWQYVAWVASLPLIEGIALCVLSCVVIKVIELRNIPKGKRMQLK